MNQVPPPSLDECLCELLFTQAAVEQKCFASNFLDVAYVTQTKTRDKKKKKKSML